MNKPRMTALMMALGLGLGLSACASVDTATRNAPMDHTATEMAAPAPSFSLAGFDVNVPLTLKVSEANSYYPGGDIVWRGDVYGNRYEQVGALLKRRSNLAVRRWKGRCPSS